MGRPAYALALLPLALAGLAAWLLMSGPDEIADASGAPDSVAADVSAPASSAEVTARRRTAGTARVTGEVRRAADRSPAADLAVTLSGPGGRSVETRTDADGAFVFAAVPHGGPYEVRVAAPGAAEVRVPAIDLARGETRDVGTLWLAPAVLVDVEVTTFGGEPIAGAAVEAFREDLAATWSPAPISGVRTLTTPPDGTARFDALAVGTYTFVATKPGFARRGSVSIELTAGGAATRVRLSLERGYRVAGRVTERDGTGIAGAVVVALPRTFAAVGSVAPLASRTVSAADGAYALETLPVSDVCIWVARPDAGLGLVAAVRPPGVPHLDLVLDPPSYVVGRVTEQATGAPVTGAVVNVTFSILGGISTGLEASAADDGSFRVLLPMEGDVASVTASAPGFLTARDRQIEAASVHATGGSVVRSELALAKGTALSGRVLADGAPAALAVVNATGPSFQQSVTCGRDGAYAFDALPAVELTVTAARAGEPDTGAGARTVNLADGPATLDLTLPPRAGDGAVLGVVVTAGGAPVEGAMVAVQGEVDLAAVATAADGTFRIAGRPREREITVTAAKNGFQPTAQSVVPGDAADPPRISLTLVPFRRVTGRVASAAGAPLVDAFVQIASADERSLVDDEWTWLASARHPVRADGTFSVEGPEAFSDCIVRAVATGHGQGFSPRIAWAEGEAERRVEITLPAECALTGRVVTAKGEPVAGARIATYPRADDSPDAEECNGAWGPAITAVSGDDGRFEVRGLFAGKWGVNASGVGLRAGRAIGDVPGGGEVRVVVERALAIAGVAVFDDGAPAAGASVWATPEGGSTLSAVTDERGAFRVEGLAAGPHALRVVPQRQGAAGFVPADVPDVAAGAEGVRVTLSRGLRIAGTVTTRGVGPAVGARVTAVTPRPDGDSEGAWCVADAAGAFEIAGLAPGPLALRVHLQGEQGERTGTFRGFTAGATDVRIVLPPVVWFRGVLVNEAGDPLPGLNVNLLPVGDGPASALDVDAMQSTTDEQGLFSFQAPADLVAEVQIAESEGLGLFDGARLSTADPPRRYVARSGASITGVVEVKGVPRGDAWVTASGSNHQRRARTDEHGAFEVKGLVAGAPYTLDARGDGLVSGPSVTAEAGARGVKVAAEPALAIAVRIVDAAGDPVASAMASFASDAENNTHWLETDADGRVRLNGVRAGAWRVSVVSGSPRRMVPCGVVQAGEPEVTLRLEPR